MSPQATLHNPDLMWAYSHHAKCTWSTWLTILFEKQLPILLQALSEYSNILNKNEMSVRDKRFLSNWFNGMKEVRQKLFEQNVVKWGYAYDPHCVKILVSRYDVWFSNMKHAIPNTQFWEAVSTEHNMFDHIWISMETIESEQHNVWCIRLCA